MPEPVQGAGDQLPESIYALASLTVRRLPRDISLTAAATLFALERHGARRVTELAQIQGVSQPTMTALISRLERDQLVQRRSDPADRRAVMVQLSPRGRSLVDDRRQAGAAAIAELLCRLPQAQRTQLQEAQPALAALCRLEQVGCGGGPPAHGTPSSGPSR